MILAQHQSIAADRINRVEYHAGPRPPVVWPVRVGMVPHLASAFQARTGLRDRIDQAQIGRTSVVLFGGGGVGKSQLAAAFAHRALADGTEVVVW
ncbi:hypothetical protein AB0953_31065 [Streptomyces sp. NPDC046866]|uniref:hypothetical protein n=1 Tax=Streptomyces sp. NPDC046866 TaxID=3154921 RepID=UPI0034551B1F